MKILILLLHFHLLYLVTACPPALRHSINRLNYELYNAYAPKEQNLVYSPIGVHFLLFLTSEYTPEDKAALFYNHLHMEPIGAIKYKKFWDKLRANRANIAAGFSNKLYIRADHTLKKSFMDTTVADFGIFVTNNLEAIKTDVDYPMSEQLIPSTDMVVLNQASFKGQWFTQFQRQTTSMEIFHTTQSTAVPSQMMHYIGYAGIRDDSYLGATIIRLNYATQYVSMYLLIPHTMEGLAAMEMKLINASTSAEAGISFLNPNMLQVSKVALAMPKFKFTRTTDLTAPLTKMGYGDAFADPHVLDIINGEMGAHLSKKLLQTVTVEVDEEGKPGPNPGNFLSTPEYNIVANHPFIFYVTASPAPKQHLILFTGKITTPM